MDSSITAEKAADIITKGILELSTVCRTVGNVTIDEKVAKTIVVTLAPIYAPFEIDSTFVPTRSRLEIIPKWMRPSFISAILKGEAILVEKMNAAKPMSKEAEALLRAASELITKRMSPKPVE